MGAMIYCEVCGEPKTKEIEAFGERRIVWIRCKCKQAEHDARLAREKEREAQEDCDRRRRQCFFGKRYLDNTFDKFEGESGLKIGLNFVEKFDDMKAEKKGLLIKGSVGTGKTFLAACITNALLDKGYTARFVTFAEIEKRLWSERDKNRVMTDLAEVDLLVIDDFGVERKTDYMNEIVTEVINERYAAGKPLIITTNINDFTKAGNVEQARIYSRIKSMCHPITIGGKDRRIESAMATYGDIENILRG